MDHDLAPMQLLLFCGELEDIKASKSGLKPKGKFSFGQVLQQKRLDTSIPETKLFSVCYKNMYITLTYVELIEETFYICLSS